MARANLEALLSNIDDKQDSQSPHTQTKRTAKTNQAVSRETHYLQFARKETRLRDDQIETLSTIARRLSRAKAPGGERITDNTLIRVAVDLLLTKTNDLNGVTEAELRKSVGL